MIKLPDNYYKFECYWAHMLTFRCAAKCPFCILDCRGRRQDSDEMSGKDIVDFWNSTEHKNGQKLSLIGGETTLHKDFEYILNNLEGFNITVTTNCKSPLFNQPDYYKKFKPHPSSSLRINTTYHPHYITADEYIEVIKMLRKTGHFVDQTAFVYRPDINKYKDEIEKVRKEIKIKEGPYLGFYNETSGFEAPFSPDNNRPNEDYHNLDYVANTCGITDMDAYRDITGRGEKQEVFCEHPMKSFIIGPNGDHYHCHYKLYYGIDPVSKIKSFKPVTEAARHCRHYGFCNWCDIPRVGCKKNQTARPIVINKLYDRQERERPEIAKLSAEIKSFAHKNKLNHNELKWFEHAYTLLYSGHRHRGKVLEVGSARSCFPYFLAKKGYDVTTLDVADKEYRDKMEQEYGVKSVEHDIREPLPPEMHGQFDLVSCLSVIEHVDRDTEAIIHLSRALKPGGVMVVSSDFYKEYIEFPDANRKIVTDRPAGSHTDSRTYTPETFIDRILLPLHKNGIRIIGDTDFGNIDINDPAELSVRGLYTFGISIYRRD